MRDAVAHRGPDGAGTVVYGGVGLAHRRLSIIDVEGGAQPLANEDGSIWVTFNGEIYNFQALRRDLVARGHRFSTRCDTEVLVHLYEEYGDDFPKRLNGIFAFALHDRKRNRVLLVRDHLGVKPLFYAVQGETLYFGSELRAVVAGLGGRPPLNAEALQEYLVFRYVCAPRTFVDDVFRLPPGHSALWENGSLELRAYWRPPAPSPASTAVSLDECVEELDRRLGLAVERQLMSDVALGVFCSGGVDSGLVTSYAARISGASLASFSYGFREAEWDETGLAADSARRAGTEHRILRGGKEEFLQWLTQLICVNDEPLSHPNSVPLAQLSKFARESVKVVLTGEGADELFCGYPRYKIAALQQTLDPLPRPAMRLLSAAARLVPDRRAHKLGSLLALTPDDQHLFNSAFVGTEQVERITQGPLNGALNDRRALLAESLLDRDALGTLSRYETLTYLVSALERIDRVSMANGLEARVPLLDIELVEWALQLPSHIKVAKGRNKAVLKALGDRYLSPRITHGPKSGFGLPLDEWFRAEPYKELMQRLGDADHPASAALDAGEVRRIRDDHLNQSANHGELLWLLANVYLWHETPEFSNSLA